MSRKPRKPHKPRKPTPRQVVQQRIDELQGKLTMREAQISELSLSLWPFFKPLVEELVNDALSELDFDFSARVR